MPDLPQPIPANSPDAAFLQPVSTPAPATSAPVPLAADSPEAQALVAPTAVAAPVPEANAPEALVSQDDYLKMLPRDEIVREYRQQLQSGKAPDKEAYYRAYEARAHEGNLLGDTDQRPSATPKPSLFARVLDTAKTLDTGLLTQANEASKFLIGKDFATGQDLGGNWDPKSQKARAEALSNLVHGSGVAGLQTLNTLRQFGVNVGNYLFHHNNAIAGVQGINNETPNARDTSLFREQFDTDEKVQAASDRLLHASAAEKLATDPETVQAVATSPLSDPTFILPFALASKEAKAANAFRGIGADASPEGASLLAKFVAKPIELAADAVKKAADLADNSPLVRAGVSGGATLLAGGNAPSAILAGLLGGSNKNLKLAQTLFSGTENTLRATAGRITGDIPLGPYSKFAANTFGQLTDEGKAFILAQAPNVPFLLGTENRKQAEDFAIVGALAHGAGNGFRMLNSGLDVNKNFFAPFNDAGEPRLPTADLGVSPTLDAEHAKTMSGVNDAGSNFVEGWRKFLKKTGVGEMYAVSPEGFRSALDELAASVGKKADEILPPGITPERAAMQRGLQLDLAGPDGKTRKVALVSVEPGVPGIATGHEITHMIFNSLSGEQQANIRQTLARDYGEEQVDNFRQKYAQDLGVKPEQVTREDALDELFAETGSAVLNSVPVSRFGPEGSKTWGGTVRKIYGLIGTALTNAGISVPEAAKQRAIESPDGSVTNIWEGAGKGPKTALGAQPSIPGSRLLENYLQAMALDKDVFAPAPEGSGEATTAADATRPNVPGVTEAAPPPSFKKGDKLAGDIYGPDGNVVGKDATILNVNEDEQTGNHTYDILFSSKGKVWKATVPEKSLQSPVKPGASDEATPAAPTEVFPKSPITDKTPFGVAQPPTVAEHPPSSLPPLNERIQRAHEMAQNVNEARRELDMVKELGGTPEQIKAAEDKVFEAELADEKYGAFGREGPNATEAPAVKPTPGETPFGAATPENTPTAKETVTPRQVENVVLPEASDFKDANGAVDSNAYGKALIQSVSDALAAGKKVELIVDNGGKTVEITGIKNGMMQDASGQRWGNLGILTGQDKVSIKETPPPAPSNLKNVHVTPSQQEAFAAKATPEVVKANTDLVKQSDALPTHEKPAYETNYYSAKGETGEDAGVREVRRKLADAAEKTGKKNPLRALYQKIFVPYRYVDGKTPRVFGFSYDKLIQNVDILKGWAASNNRPDLVTRLSDSQFANTVRDYLRNQSNGYGGDGRPVTLPADTRPGTITTRNPGFKPVKLAPADAQLVNLLIGVEQPQKSSPASQFAARMAKQNGLTPERNAAGVEITNPLYTELTGEGLNPKVLNSVVENLPIDRMTTPLKPRPDIQFPAGDLGITRAGFMPATREDYTTRAETFGGRLISSDLVRTSLPDYDRNNPGATHEQAAYAANQLYREKLADPKVDNVIFTAGPAGAGKTVSIRGALEDQPNSVVFDSTLGGTRGIARIEDALNAGKQATVLFTYAPFETTLQRIKSRAEREGRTVPAESAATNYRASAENFLSLYESLKDNPNIEFRVFDNSGDHPVAVDNPAEFLYKQLNETPDQATLHERAKEFLAPQETDAQRADKQAGGARPEESADGSQAPRVQGNPVTREIAAKYVADSGIGQEPHTGYAPVNEDFAKRLADFYTEAKDEPNAPEVQSAYKALADETLAQYGAMKAAGVEIEPYTGKGEPYANSKAMMQDVRDNKHLYFLKTEGNFEGDQSNALLRDSGIKAGGQKLLVNDVFRAVHDFFGHTAEGYEFGPRGEYNAYLAHSRMFSDEAKPALAAETLAQNSYVNYGKHLRREDGSIPAKGEEGFVPLKDRPFAPQKNLVVPHDLLNEADSAANFLPSVKVQHNGKTLEYSLGEDTLNLIHFAGNQGLKEVDPKNFGKSGLTPRSELAGAPRSYFYEQGKTNKFDPVANRDDVYGAKVSGSKIYDGDADPLGYESIINREKADRMLKDAGYIGIARTGDKYRQVELFQPTKVQSLESPKARFLPQASPKQETAFKDSKVRDANGDLLPVFHGTYSDFKKFKQGDLGYHFGTQEAANARIGKALSDLNPHEISAENAFDAFPEMRENMPPGARGAIEGIADGARTLPVFLDIKNPLRMPDVGPWDDPAEVDAELPPKISNDPKVKRAVEQYVVDIEKFKRKLGASERANLAFEEAKGRLGKEALAAIRDKLKSAGYDGVVYENDFEAADNRNLTGRDWLNNPPKDNDSYIAFDNSQIMPAYSHDAKARFLPAAPPNTPEFKKWFGSSKVVDEVGNPQPMYRGAVTTKFPEVTWFSDSPRVASAYAKNADKMFRSLGHFGQTIPAYLSLKNPLIASAGGEDFSGIDFEGRRHDPETLVELAKERGHDGVIIDEVVDSPDEEYRVPEARSAAIFNSSQAKSAIGNNGKFDATNPDIRFMPAIAEGGEKVAIPGNPKLQDARETRTYKNIARHLTPAEAKDIRRDTAQKIVDLYKELPADEDFETAVHAGHIKKGWYQRAADSLQFIFGPDTEKFVSLLAATSPRQSVQENLKMALNIWADWQDAGRPTHDADLKQVIEKHAEMHSRVPNSIRALQGEDLATPPKSADTLDKVATLSGPKVESFKRNLLGDLSASTNDTWMALFSNIDQAQFGTKSGYLAMNAKVRKVADKLNLKPAEVQETIWSFFKTLTEATTVDRPAKEALRNLTESDILKAPEFHEQILSDPAVKKQLERLGFTGFDSLARRSNPAVARAGSLANIALHEGGERRRLVLDRIAQRAQSLKDLEVSREAKVAPADEEDPF